MTRQVVAETRWLARTSLVSAHEHVACDRGGGDHIERVDPGGQGAWMHRNADGLIGLAQPVGRQAIAFGAEQKRGPLADAPALGVVDGIPVRTPFAGLVRGLVADGTPVSEGVKIGDVDPRQDTDWHEISDKALAVAGGVLEAVLTWLNASGGVRPTGAPARTGSRPLAPGR